MLTNNQILKTETNFLLGSLLVKLVHLHAVGDVEEFTTEFKKKLEKDGEPKEVVEAFENFIKLYLA